MIEKKELCEKNEMVGNKEIYEKIIEIHEQEETSIEKRIIEILDACDKSTSFSNSLSAFEQAGFITKSEPLSKKERDDYIKLNNYGDYSECDMIKTITDFDSKKSRKIRQMIHPELNLSIEKEKRNLIAIEGEINRKNRLEKNRRIKEIEEQLKQNDN